MKDKIPKDSVFKKKGFYVALYSCLGAVMVLAAVASFGNFAALKDAPEGSRQSAEAELGPMEMTGSTGQGSTYLTPEDAAVAVEKAEQKQQAKPSAAPETPKASPLPTKPNVTSETPPAPHLPGASKATEQKPEATEQKPAAEPAAEEKKTSETPDESGINVSQSETAPVAEKPEFTAFADGSAMEWPVLGEVVMKFSDTHAIYDQTLDQYRTNDTMCIAADLGSQVVASAEGIVSKVSKTREDGNKVTIDHGNGWLTTYSQLQDGVLVKEGDIVEKGQVIGGVASPSIYSVLLGNHVGFKVTKDEALVDPMTMLDPLN